MKAWRIILSVAGVALATFGAYRLFTEVPLSSLVLLALWLLGALLIHDGLLSPVVVGVGWTLRRWVPDRGRRFLQAGLIVAGLVCVVAIPMIYRQGTHPAAKALLLRPYDRNLSLILGLVAIITLTLYAIRVARDATTPGVGAQPRSTAAGSADAARNEGGQG